MAHTARRITATLIVRKVSLLPSLESKVHVSAASSSPRFQPVSTARLPESIGRLQQVLGPEKLYIVGGILRDSLLTAIEQGHDTLDLVQENDWDLATPLRPKEVMARLRSAGIKAIPIGIEHGTVAALINGETIEITTFRHDVESIDGRHAVVRFADSLEEDLQRRDFTVNAFAMDVERGALIDLFGGIDDLCQRCIRTVGEPVERFHEDYLRMLRAIRFAAKLEGRIDDATHAAIQKTAPRITQIAAERIRDELMKMLGYPRPSHGFALMHETLLLPYILPELEAGFGCWQNRFHADDVAWHTLHTTDAVRPSEPLVRWMALMHDLGKVPKKLFKPEKGDYVFYGHQYASRKIAKRTMLRLRFSNREIEKTTSVVEHHMYNLKPDLSDAAIKRFVRKLGRENVDDFLRMRMADRRGNRLNEPGYEKGIFHFVRQLRRIEKAEEAMSLRDLAINGHDLMAMGLQPGPLFSLLLDRLLDEVLENPEANTREQLTERAQTLAHEYSATGTIPPANNANQDDESEEACANQRPEE
mgnify:CR=1 FL=1